MVSRPGVRIACVREVQLSIKDSVRQLLIDIIQRLQLGHLFTVLDTEIRGPNGSLCIFRGMKDQNAESIKSLEGFDIFWWEEAQTASEKSLMLLRPTMRKAGGEMWFTWNPRFKTDPIDVLLRQNPPEGAVVVEANWGDNPWFSKELEEERSHDLLGDRENYLHVWEGHYLAADEMQLISAKLVEVARKNSGVSHPTDELVLGVDVARGGSDRSTIAVRRGRDAKTRPWEVFGKGDRRQRDTMQLAAHVAHMIDDMRPDATFVDEGGVGGGVIDRLNQMGYDITPVNSSSAADGLTRVKCANKRAEMWQRMKEWMGQPDIAIPDSTALETDLTGPLFKYDANNAILLEKKEDMKKRGVRSPDEADALALTFAYPVVPMTEKERLEEAEEAEYDPFDWR